MIASYQDVYRPGIEYARIVVEHMFQYFIDNYYWYYYL